MRIDRVFIFVFTKNHTEVSPSRHTRMVPGQCRTVDIAESDIHYCIAANRSITFVTASMHPMYFALSKNSS